MSPVAQTLFAAWLAENQPAVFNALLRRAAPQLPAQGLSGFTDILKSIGGTIGSAAKTVVTTLGSAVQSVGGFLTTSGGQQTLQTALQVYAQTQMPAAQTIAQQQALAQSGAPPADVQMAWDPASQTWVPTGATRALQAGQIWAQYGPWILAGGAALLAILFLRRR